MKISNKDINKDNEKIPESIKRLLVRIIEAEKDKLHMKNPNGIIQDIIKITKEEIKSGS
jgi:uncharacterized protein (DUF2267 family)